MISNGNYQIFFMLFLVIAILSMYGKNGLNLIDFHYLCYKGGFTTANCVPIRCADPELEAVRNALNNTAPQHIPTYSASVLSVMAIGEAIHWLLLL